MNTYKTNFLTALLLFAALPAGAVTLTPAEALQRASADSPAFARGIGRNNPTLVHTVNTIQGEPAVYVFNSPDRGYVMLSADDVAIPLLGYADNGNFSSDNMPPQLQWWLSEYARRIEFARKNNITSPTTQRRVSRMAGREAITPQLKTYWDQVEPFNGQCPLDGTDRTWTGCVATAMAQVMDYWQYPEKGRGSITYTIESLEKKVSMDFSKKKFDWDNMLPMYIPGEYSSDEADAVAYLMKAAGYAVKMQYSMDASGALAMNIGNALTKYFGYDPNLLYTLRQYYSTAQWEEMVYDNLKNVGPILYGGGSTLGGGHSFVCDGYDGNGMFHFNWGWSGMSDGYFSLDALSLDALGTGGGAGGGYNFTQDAVFGVQPPTGAPAESRPLFLTQEGGLKGSVKLRDLWFELVDTTEPMWVNYNPSTMYLKFGAMFIPQGDGEAVYHDISDKRFSLQPGYGTNTAALKPKVNLDALNLKDGTYKVVVGTVELEQNQTSSDTDGEGFVEIRPSYGSPNYVTLKVEGNNYSVTDSLLPPLKVTGEVIGGLYYGCLNKVKVTVENTSDLERTSGFAPVFMDAEGPLLLGQSILVTIPAHSTVTREWDTDLTQFVQFIDPYLGSNVNFTFFNEDTYDFYNDAFLSTVRLNPNPGTPAVKVETPLAVTGATVDKRGNIIIPDANDINVTGSLLLQDGVFRYPVVVCLCIPAGNNQIEIISTAAQNMFLSMDDIQSRTGDIDIRFSYPIADPAQQYYLALTYNSSAGLYPLADAVKVRFADRSGIEQTQYRSGMTASRNPRSGEITVAADEGIESVEIFDITGRRIYTKVEHNGDKAVIPVPSSGIMIVKVCDRAGNSGIFKLN